MPAGIWRRLFEHAPDPQIVTDPEGRVLAANPGATRLLESRECPLLGSNVLTLAAPRDQDRVRSLLRRLRESRPRVLESELELRTPDGDTTSVAVSLLSLGHDRVGLEAVGWALRLVGQPRTLAGRLQRSRQEASDLRAALDQASAVVELDREGRVTVANERLTHLLGRPHEELVGCSVVELGLGPELETRLPEARRRLLRGRAWAGELRVTAAGGDVRWVNTTVVPLLDADGRPHRFLALVDDVTRHRQAVDRLERAEGLVRLGAMAAVVAHEVRNPLAAAQGALEVIGPRVPAEEDREVLADVSGRLSELNRLVDDILLYARPPALELQDDDLCEIVQRVVQELENDPRMEDVELQVETPRACPARLDAAAIRAVLLNLVRNAAEAMEGQGRVRILVERGEEWRRVRVRDEGPGIPEDMREAVFEPFVSFRHRGSGLGLAISRQTAEAHGGHLGLEPAPGGGTDAVLQLPAAGL